MSKKELLQRCKELNIKGVSSKNKDELLFILKDYEENKAYINNKNEEVNIKPSYLNNVLNELLSVIPKDKCRKVCKNCNELGHTISSKKCKINIEKNKIIKGKIKQHMITRNCLENKTIDELCDELSVILNITPNLCKTLYNEIPLEELFDKQLDIPNYLKDINHLSKQCIECNKNMLYIQTNTNRIWKGNEICDTCWHYHDDERQLLWKKVKEYKFIQCEICSSIQQFKTERYHYDHFNMFNKDKSICTMINEGIIIEDIYNEIDKCQILCLSCHHIVTDIEHKLGFTRIKQILTRKLNQCELTEEEYNKQKIYYESIYQEKMKNIYKELKLTMLKLHG